MATKKQPTTEEQEARMKRFEDVSKKFHAVEQLAKRNGYNGIGGSPGVQEMLNKSLTFLEWYLDQVIRFLNGDLGDTPAENVKKHIKSGAGFYMMPADRLDDGGDEWDFVTIHGEPGPGQNTGSQLGWELHVEVDPRLMMQQMLGELMGRKH